MHEELLSLDEALARLRSAVETVAESEELPLERALGRTLAEAVVADTDLPPFDSSLVDGYALPAWGRERYRVVGSVYAGRPWTGRLEPDECLAVMTGAALPAACVGVVMEEEARRAGDWIAPPPGLRGDLVARRGRDARAGEALLPAGTVLNPAGVACAAAAGRETVRVRRGIVAWLATSGDELAAGGTGGLAPGMVRDQTGPALAARLSALPGVRCDRRAVLPDRPEAVAAFLAEFEAGGADLLLLAGGAGRGERDYARGRLESAGWDIVFERLRLQPGKPTIAARRGNRLAIGLPGNPVSSLVAFELFVPAAVAAWNGRGRPETRMQARLEGALARDSAERLALVPARLRWTDDGPVCAPAEYRGSAHVGGFAGAGWAIEQPAGEREWPAGAAVTLRRLWGEA